MVLLQGGGVDAEVSSGTCDMKPVLKMALLHLCVHEVCICAASAQEFAWSSIYCNHASVFQCGLTFSCNFGFLSVQGGSNQGNIVFLTLKRSECVRSRLFGLSMLVSKGPQGCAKSGKKFLICSILCTVAFCCEHGIW